MTQDTVAAVATGLAEAAIGIVRLSGPEALEIVDRIFVPRHRRDWRAGPGYRMVYGKIVDPGNGRRVDEVLVAVMRAPRSYTREDVVEIHAHGGPVPLRRILQLVLLQGARLAEPGEFTKRAFLNGRLDLAQAEAVIDVIRAQTEDGLEIALEQLAGGLSRQVNELREKALEVLASVEASIDFPEDDLPPAGLEELPAAVREIAGTCRRLAAEGEIGRIYRDGLRTVILGKPNVGKSSLLNALLGEQRAIVTAVPGTTRDTIEEAVNLRGIPLRLVDTAGLRHTTDEVERIGVERARAQASRAELTVVMLDASTGIGDEDRAIMELVRGRRCIAVINKTDLVPDGITPEEVEAVLGPVPVVRMSVTEGRGIGELAAKIEELVLGGRVRAGERPLVSNARHRAALARAAEYLESAAVVMDGGGPLELAADDLRAAVEALGEITGAGLGEEVLDRIFERFCVGK
ncbi:MAG: tRNA uridine-5-carboxymethylaminomethyl(34) synthesis GTPase MnmE [Thermoanaerobacterales bacterium]|nr:tRNA uridine-5-carboxymethylaminomethyl(34) synthesis GTPase MnmE [Bacillota bacterium]MDI6907749.1 tRNA uridine-5-carboxymethylaminomethyl(34) synthesis GTPase MnmE [Thermoanaerobacterales bacterium]